MDGVGLQLDAAQVFKNCKDEAERQLAGMRSAASEMFDDRPNFVIGVNGSVARRECTSGSDVDLFFLYNGKVTASDARKAQTDFRSRLQAMKLDMPAHGGVFEKPLKITDLLRRIGGDKDTNVFITRRMLFLLEGEWTFNKALFVRTRTQLIEHYVADDLEERKLTLFLLNDVIRYWRTICVDFEHKTADADKPRAIRLIKLRFSRMLLYFAGVAAVSQTKDLSVEKKREKLVELFDMPTMARLRSIFGEPMEQPLSRYAQFLSQLDDKDVRTQLKLPGEKGLATQVYAELCEEARKFKADLLHVLMAKFGSDHDVVKALLL
jgi:predicted nucleotidyltransferase